MFILGLRAVGWGFLGFSVLLRVNIVLEFTVCFICRGVGAMV